VNFIRYADDFVITGRTKELLEEEIKPIVEQFLQERGLELSPTKTVITHVEKGFDFLGQNVRRYPNGKLRIQPSKKNVKTFLAGIRKTIKAALGKSAADLIEELNPKVRGWANYHRHVVSKRTFSHVDCATFWSLWRWARRRHRNKNLGWIKEKYFERHQGRDWTSSGNPTIRRGHRRRCGCYPPLVHPSQDTLKSEAKPTGMIPHMKPTSQIAKGPICEMHFGVRKFFAFSGTIKTDVVPYAVRKSPASPAGACIIASPWRWVARKGLQTAFFFTQSAATRFTACIFVSLNRIFLNKAIEGLEPYTAKALRTVLRGLGPSNGVRPLGLRALGLPL
jgi:Group II intron, maturase-specific domain/Reverse transcriptase (RNA-dependent DNA polymerase)